jgi:hypothetical protein
MPVASDLRAECRDHMPVGRNAVVRDVAAHHRVEPSPLLRDGLVATSLHFAAELVQLRRHPLPLCLPSQEEPSTPRTPANMREPKEVEGIRLPAETPVLSP